MSKPNRLSAYPPAYAEAFRRAQAMGSITIPTDKPAALRMQLYGFAKVARRDGLSTLVDPCQITLGENFVRISLREISPLALDLEKALSSPAIPEDEYASALDRILGDTPHG